MGYVILMMALFCSPAMADVYIITDASGSVYTVSEKDDTVVPAGYTKKSVKGKLTDLSVSKNVTEYKYDGKTFKVDTAKIKSKEDEFVAMEAATAKAEADRISAMSKLTALGLTEAEAKVLVKE